MSVVAIGRRVLASVIGKLSPRLKRPGRELGQVQIDAEHRLAALALTNGSRGEDRRVVDGGGWSAAELLQADHFKSVVCGQGPAEASTQLGAPAIVVVGGHLNAARDDERVEAVIVVGLPRGPSVQPQLAASPRPLEGHRAAGVRSTV